MRNRIGGRLARLVLLTLTVVACTTASPEGPDPAAREPLVDEHPSWIDGAVMYAPIARLWGKGGPKAVQQRLPYLKKMGVDVLWLWPPTSLRAPGEEYAITDYFKVDPSWGPKSALKELIDEAHALGLRVLIDFVPNHMSVESPYFRDAEERGEQSRYWDFFERASGTPTYYFDWNHLPNLNFDNAEVRNLIIDASAYWVREMEVDGFRMDVAWGVERRRPGFWPEWRRELKRIDPNLLLLAEASGVEPYWFSNGFDVAYDWTNELGEWAWSTAFDSPREAGARLAHAITNGDEGYASDALLLRFLNNNDTGVRFVDRHGPDLTRVAAALQFTLPGLPALFAGDEIGASYEPYSELNPIPWRDRYGLRPFYEKLIDLRHEIPALTSRELDVLTVDPNSALAYLRPAEDEPVLVLLNFGEETRVEIGGLPESMAPDGAMRDLLTGESVELRSQPGSVSVDMDAESALVLSP